MRPPSAFGSRTIGTCFAAVLFAGCAEGPSPIDYRHARDPDVLPKPPATPAGDSSGGSGGDSHAPEHGGEATGDIFLDRPLVDAGSSAAVDASSATLQADAAGANTLLASDAGTSPVDAGANERRCQPGSRSLVQLTVPGRARGTVLLDERYIYYQLALPNGAQGLRQDIMALPRAVLHDPTLPVTPAEILHSDYALGALADDGGDYLYFIGMPQGDTANQGLFRVQKRERVALESLPVHALLSDDYWPGQLAVDANYFYLASIGASSHALRIVRIARSGFQREELWLDTSASNDTAAAGALTLRQGDIALDRDHVYFSARVSGSSPQQFRVYRLNKQDSQQTPQLVTQVEGTLGGVASDATRLFFNGQSALEQWDLAGSAREQLTSQPAGDDLRQNDGVISWAPGDPANGNLTFFCL